MSDDFERLRELCQVAPPPELDACVQRRMQDLLRAARTAAPTSAAAVAAPLVPAQLAAPERVAPQLVGADIISSPHVLPAVERWIYAVGLFAYGTLVVLGAARLFWRALAG
jgi:hypothetical protein